MKKSRLVEIFNSLSKKEQRSLGKFVESPFFNKREDVIKLYKILYKKYPFNKENDLKRELIFKQIFPNQSFDEKKMDYTMSFLFQLIKSYLIYEEMHVDKVNSQVLLSRSLRKRNLPRIFETEIKTAEKLLDNQQFRNKDYHFNRFQLYLEKCEFDSSQRRTETSGFQVLSDELTKFFITNRLWQSCTAQLHKTVNQVEYRQDLLNEILTHVERNNYEDSPAINIYYHNYKALTEENSKPWFDSLRKLIRNYTNQFPKQELREFYIGTINYCIKQFNAGKKDFLAEAFELYKEGFSTEVFIEKGVLSRFTYNNVVISGLLLKEFEWVEQFIYDYKGAIEERFRESTFNYNLANLYFRKPDYPKAMELLQRVEFDDVMHSLNARRMLLKIYYETNEFDALSSLLTSFKNYIYRHKELGGNHRNSYLNLIKFTNKLLNLNGLDKEGVIQIKKEIEETEPVAEKAWLLGVLN